MAVSCGTATLRIGVEWKEWEATRAPNPTQSSQFALKKFWRKESKELKYKMLKCNYKIINENKKLYTAYKQSAG